MGFATSLKRRATSLAESHPLLWYLAWTLVHRVPALLPHDQSYKAIRHFPGIDGALLLDVGANDGISVLSFHKLNPTLRFLSLEPNGIHEPSLRKLKARVPGADYRMVAAGDAPAEIDLYTPVCFGVALHTATSGDRERLIDWVDRQYGRLAARSTRIVHTRAPLVTIDSLGVDPRIIKIDAEGFDLQVIRGASETIRRNRPFIITEGGDADAVAAQRQLLTDLGYGLFSYDPGAGTFGLVGRDYDPALPGHRNIFAIPVEHQAAIMPA